MQENQQQQVDVSNAILTGLNTLSDPDIKVRGSDIEALATFKGILKAILNGELVLTTPDKILSDEVVKPSLEEKKGDE